jgi:predicted  nucleic acid-binding Zn-ribbon protein
MDQAPTPPASTHTPKQLLQVMIRLQELDKKRDANESLIARAAELVKLREREVEQKRLIEQRAETALVDARKAAHGTELELKSKAANVQKLELQLNTAKTNQEYQALLQHIGRLREEISREEDSGLVHYEAIEGREKALKAAREVVAAAEKELAEYRLVCERDVAEAGGDLRGTEGKRAELLGKLTPELRETYLKLRQAREGIAIVPLDGRCCGGCGVTVIPNEISKLTAGNTILACKSCQRVLYSTAAIPYV